jgi:hypothetical protein
MPTYPPPLCFNCKKYGKKEDILACEAYDKIPETIYFEAGDCKYYDPKKDTVNENAD